MSPYTIENSVIELRSMPLPCGGTAFFDEGAGYGYRCGDCMAVVGGIGQPQHCKDEADKYKNWEKLGGKGWNYNG